MFNRACDCAQLVTWVARTRGLSRCDSGLQVLYFGRRLRRYSIIDVIHGRRRRYADPLFVKVVVVMNVWHLTRPVQMLDVLDEPTLKMLRVRAR